MTFERKKLGAAGEELAAQFLLNLGYQILARNLKNRYGEIDILALDSETLVIVEVKAKTNSAFGVAAEMVGPRKLHKLRQVAMEVARQYHKVDYRIDVIAVDNAQSEIPTVQHYKNALA